MRFSSVKHAIVASILLSGVLVEGRPQQQGNPGMGSTRPATNNPMTNYPGKADADDSALRGLQQSQVRARNDERQKRLVADTEKLLALATQLHADVAKTDKNVLSLDVIRRSEEIEKLAHNIKERMKG